jgi:hypothetical protein
MNGVALLNLAGLVYLAASATSLSAQQIAEDWILAPGQSDVPLRCNQNGSGTVTLPRSPASPVKCSRSGNQLTVRSWASTQQMNQGEPPLTVFDFVVDGDYIEGTLTNRGFAPARITGKRAETAGRRGSAQSANAGSSSSERSSGTSSNGDTMAYCWYGGGFIEPRYFSDIFEYNLTDPQSSGILTRAENEFKGILRNTLELHPNFSDPSKKIKVHCRIESKSRASRQQFRERIRKVEMSFHSGGNYKTDWVPGKTKITVTLVGRKTT